MFSEVWNRLNVWQNSSVSGSNNNEMDLFILKGMENDKEGHSFS